MIGHSWHILKWFNCCFLQSQCCLSNIKDAFLRPAAPSTLRPCFFPKADGWPSLQPPSQTCYHATTSKCLASEGQQAGARQAHRWRGGRTRLWERSPLAACTDSHSPCCRLLLCALTARKARLPLGMRADRLIIVSHVVVVGRCSLAPGLQVPGAGWCHVLCAASLC